MRVPSPTQGNTRITRQGMDYLRPANVDFSGLISGLNTFAAGLASAEAEAKRQKDQAARFDATRRLVDFNTGADLNLDQQLQNSPPGDTNLAERAINSYENYEGTFINTLPEDLREEFRMRTADTRRRIVIGATEAQRKGLQTYQAGELDKQQNAAKTAISQDDTQLEQWKADMDRMIDESDYSAQEKAAMKQKNAQVLEEYGYRKVIKDKKMTEAAYTSDLVGAAKWASQETGLSPVDILTIISFETGGTFSTSQRGGAGGKHLGLIQFGPSEQAQFGVRAGQTPLEQMKAVVAFLQARGFKRGMDIYDFYSTINAGAPGRLKASDTASGGTWGTVADKVNFQMADHRAKALALLDGRFSLPDDIDSNPRFANVPYEDRVSIRKDTDTMVRQLYAEAEQQRKQQQASYLNDMYNSLQSGAAGRTEFEQAIADGMIPDFEDRKKGFDIIDKKEKDGIDLREGLAKLGSGIAFDAKDSEDKKRLNAMFGQSGVDALNKQDEAYVKTSLGPTFVKAGALAPDAVSMLRAQSTSNNPAQMLFALRTLNYLENLNTSAYNAQIPDDMKKRADQFESLVNVMEPKDLINVLRGAPTEGQRLSEDQMRAEAQRKFAADDAPRLVDNAEAIGGQAPGHHLILAEREREWQALVTENYVKVGNWDSAIELANKQLRRVWAPTAVGDGTPLMRNPPELIDPDVRPINGSFEWANRQVRGLLGIPEDIPFQLVSDDKTQAQKERGEKPTYLVAVNNQYGWGFATDDKNRVMRISLKPTEQDQALQVLELQKGHIDEELKTLIQLQSNPYGVGVPIPEETAARIKELQTKKLELDAATHRQSVVTQTQYDPLALELEKMRERFKVLDKEFAYAPDPMTWEGLDEYKKLRDKIRAAEVQLQEKTKDQMKKLEPK